MTLGDLHIFFDNDRTAYGVRASNLDTGDQNFEGYWLKRPRCLSLKVYETDREGRGSQMRVSFYFLWICVNFMLWNDVEKEVNVNEDKGGAWGWVICDHAICFYWGIARRSWDLPWITNSHVRTELMDTTRTRIICDRDKLGRWDEGGYEKWCNVKKTVTRSFPYKYVTTRGVSQFVTASCVILKTTRRRKWWMTENDMDFIDITFSEEVGEGRGSYKGGCIGCAYEMKDGESMEQTLRRMEKDRRFSR